MQISTAPTGAAAEVRAMRERLTGLGEALSDSERIDLTRALEESVEHRREVDRQL
jgi:hypothetical protein